MKLNVGDFCYLKESRDYGIGQITQLNSGYSSNGGELIDVQFKHSKHSVPKTDVISSPNIINLIKVGDYANDYYVEDIINYGKELVLHIETGSNYFISPFLYNENIKSVLTHEQFEAMQYVVGEE